MLGRGGRLLRKVDELGFPADLAKRRNHSLLEYRDHLQALRSELVRFVAKRHAGLLRKTAAIAGASCTVVAGIDWLWPLLSDLPGYLPPEAAGLTTIVGFAALVGSDIHGRYTKRRLVRVVRALGQVEDELGRVWDEIDARLLGHRHPPPKTG